MKHLDTLLDELQHPVDIVQAWCDADKDRAVVACLWDLMGRKDGVIFEVLREVEGYDLTDFAIAECIIEMAEEIHSAYEEGRTPEFDYVALYQPLEHIINDRIEFYNRS